MKMPVEIIGEVGTPGAERERTVAECELAINHLKKVCGEPPPETEFDIQWQEHDLGEYPLSVLTWEDAMCVAPWDCIARCEAPLTAEENGGQLPSGWPMLSVALQDDDEFDEEYRISETPPERLDQEAKDPITAKFTDPEPVQSALVRAKRLLAPSPQKLKEMPTNSKRIH